jgi:hypothetical protein
VVQGGTMEGQPGRGDHASSWDDLGWPLLAGTVVATGLWAAYLALGAVFVVAFIVVLDLAITPLAQGLGGACGKSARRATTVVAPAWAVGAAVCLGLASALRGWTPIIMVGLVLTAPTTRALLLDARRRAARHTGQPGPHRRDERRRREEVRRTLMSRTLARNRSGLRCVPHLRMSSFSACWRTRSATTYDRARSHRLSACSTRPAPCQTSRSHSGGDTGPAR